MSWGEELAATPPGPDLFARLEGIDPRVCSGSELVDLVDAHYQQVAFQQSRLLLAIRELAFTTSGQGRGERTASPDPYADAELAFALTVSDYGAGQLLSAAIAAIDTLPDLHEALAGGRLDLAKVSMITSELSEVEPDTARAIVAELLPEAPRCTLAQLRQRLRQLILAVDPEAVKQRSKKAVERRFVEHTEYANGTSALCGMYLATDRAAAAWEHIDAIATATKSGGDPLGREIDQLCQLDRLRRRRADVFADLLAGVDPTLAGAATPAPRKGVDLPAHQHHHPGLPRRRPRRDRRVRPGGGRHRPADRGPDGPDRPVAVRGRGRRGRPDRGRGPAQVPAHPDPDQVRQRPRRHLPRPRLPPPGPPLRPRPRPRPRPRRPHHHRQPVLPLPAPPPGQTRRPIQASAAPSTASTGPPPAAPPTPSYPNRANHPAAASTS